MILPKLDPVRRSREYTAYGLEQRGAVVRGWLFDGKTHRQLDRDVLGLDPAESRGYQSMGILHHLGLKAPYRGLFGGWEIDRACTELAASDQAFGAILEHIVAGESDLTIEFELFRAAEDDAVRESTHLSSAVRRTRIEAAQTHPKRVRVFSYAFQRNPDVVAEALARARGICEKCGSRAPFLRATDGTPYLEVHHRVALAAGGADSLDNVVAMCPNCHRQAHYGES
jgi:5-methylcytosine-specific restriction protein A